MAQTKFNCNNCRRLIPITSTFCPFCSSAVVPPVTKKINQKEDGTQPSKLPKVEEKHTAQVEEVDFVLNQSDINHEEKMNQPTPSKITADTLFEEELSPEFQKKSPIKVSAPIKRTTPYEEKQNTNNLSNLQNHEKVQWKDEQEDPKKTDEMYKKGVYNPNYDGMYDDTLPLIEKELENLKSGKEKMIFKIIFGFIAIFGIIIYLVLTI